MNHLVISLIVLYAVAYCDASIFSWGSSSESKEAKVPGYLPILKVHKYNGIQIHPLQGSPIYLPNEPNELNNIEAQTAQLTHEQLQQLDVINRLATFLPSDDNSLEEMDLSAVLPYVDLISEDSLEKFKLTVEANKPKEKSKILKLLAFLKKIKEKKLKPFKYVAGLGSSIVHKKKNWLFGSASTTTPEPFTVLTPTSYPPYNFAYNPNFIPHKQFFNSIPTPAAVPPPPAPLPFNFYPPNSIYEIKNEPGIPLESSLPPKQLAERIELPKAPLNTPSLPALPSFPQFPANFQFPSFLPAGQFQPNPAPVQNLPPQTQTQYQYPSLPAPSAESAKNKITYEYTQTPAHTFATQDNQPIRQFVTFNQAELPSTPPAKSEPSKEPQYSYHAPQGIPLFYQNSVSSNDLIAAGSENVAKFNEQAKPESSTKSEAESSIINNAMTSTEISVSKSQPSSPKRIILRPVTTPTRPTVVYPSPPKDESSKDDSNNSSPVNPSTTK